MALRQTDASNNTWSSYLFNYQTQAWDHFYTSSGTFDLSDRGYGWVIFEIYSTRDPATGNAWYCAGMAGQRFEASDIQVNLRGTWSAADHVNAYSYGAPPPSGTTFDCPALSFTMVKANENWVAEIGAGSGASTDGDLADAVGPGASSTTP